MKNEFVSIYLGFELSISLINKLLFFLCFYLLLIRSSCMHFLLFYSNKCIKFSVLFYEDWSIYFCIYARKQLTFSFASTCPLWNEIRKNSLNINEGNEGRILGRVIRFRVLLPPPPVFQIEMVNKILSYTSECHKFNGNR